MKELKKKQKNIWMLESFQKKKIVNLLTSVGFSGWCFGSRVFKIRVDRILGKS